MYNKQTLIFFLFFYSLCVRVLADDSELEKLLKIKYSGSEVFFSVGGDGSLGHNEFIEPEKVSIRIHGTITDFQDPNSPQGTVVLHKLSNVPDTSAFKRISSQQFIQRVGNTLHEPPIIITEGYIHPDDERLIRHLKEKYGVDPIVFVIPEPDHLDEWILKIKKRDAISDEEITKLLLKGELRKLIDRTLKTEDELLKRIRIDDIRWILSKLEEDTQLDSRRMHELTHLRSYFQECINSREHLSEEKKAGISALANVKDFFVHQYKKSKYIRAPITMDAIFATIPRALIPFINSSVLLFINRNEVSSIERGLSYIALSFGFSVGFGLISQSVLNWINYWSDFTREGLSPAIKRFKTYLEDQERKLINTRSALESTKNILTAFNLAQSSLVKIGKLSVPVLQLLSARGDVLIACPSFGIFCVYLSRLILGPMGETHSVFTLSGVGMVICNVVLGTVAGGPWNEMITHLRAVGKISNKLAIWLAALDTVKMEFGRVADFGYQKLYNVMQVIFATTFWSTLAITNSLYPKSNSTYVKDSASLRYLQQLYENFSRNEAVINALECNRSIDESKKGTNGLKNTIKTFCRKVFGN